MVGNVYQGQGKGKAYEIPEKVDSEPPPVYDTVKNGGYVYENAVMKDEKA